jgi:hypothetical protein
VPRLTAPQPVAFVFFATAAWKTRNRPVTLGRRLRAAWRHPRRAYWAFLSWLVRTLARCEWAHVAIGNAEVVLDPAATGDRMLGTAWFVTEYPGLAWMVTVPMRTPVRLIPFAVIPPRARRVLPTFIRWLTHGLWPTRDCVAVVSAVLRDDGLPVPRWVVTPGHLFDWLRSEGYRFDDLTGFADAGSEGDMARPVG